MHLLANTSLPAASIAIILAASGGMIAALVALLKLRPEASQMAVLQAQGAVETMAQLQDELEKALARANDRADAYQRDLATLRVELSALQRRYDLAVEHWGPFPMTADQEGST